MTDKTQSQNRSNAAGDYDAERDAELFRNVPQSIREQVYEYRRTREPGRRLLTQQLKDYDEATRREESTILQIYEMSLQSRSRVWSLRDERRSRKRDRGLEP